MLLRNIEDLLKRLVEGIFSRANDFLEPLEIQHKIISEIELSRTIDTQGHHLAPNRFVVRIAGRDFEHLASNDGLPVQELAATVKGYAAKHSLNFLGPVSVEFRRDDQLPPGSFKLHPSYDESVPQIVPEGWLETEEGEIKHRLANTVMVVGRIDKADIVIKDQNVSRRHAEFHPMGNTFRLLDLSSTNGSKVNGQKIENQVLVDGDELTFGSITYRFRQP